MEKLSKNMETTEKNILQNNKKVLVGISGGVDSSVAAILLKKQGYQVEGVFAKVWQPDFIECTWRDEMKDAMRICAKLDIPFHFLDLEKEYEEHVAQYMITEYQNGRTPNPDVMCNTHIKFGFMYEYAMKNGFEYVATGHYAQNKGGQLHRGLDENKDQSYFLWNVSKEKYKHILFPVGELKKSEVRSIAKKNNLFTSEKKDSQGLCFIGPVDMKSFLKKLIKTEPGSVINDEGTIIGEHEGSVLYTIGERHGFRIFSEYKKTDDPVLYVVDKNLNKNTITVSKNLRIIERVVLANSNLFAEISNSKEVQVQFRYRQKPITALLETREGLLQLGLNSKSESIAIGQSVVFYEGTKCLGGAIVDKVL